MGTPFLHSQHMGILSPTFGTELPAPFSSLYRPAICTTLAGMAYCLYKASRSATDIPRMLFWTRGKLLGQGIVIVMVTVPMMSPLWGNGGLVFGKHPVMH